MPARSLQASPTIVAVFNDGDDLQDVGRTAVPEELPARPPPLDLAGAPLSLSQSTLPDEPSQDQLPSSRGQTADPQLRAGMQLGDYRLDDRLGEGATASVWRATDTRLHMPIALKLFDPRGRAGQAVLRAVMREARAASRVVSDHVIRVKDAGHFDELGLGFIAMELCAGMDDGGLVIGKALDQQLPRTRAEAIRLIAQAARGVDDAHREGVFHRDVKPGNILMRPGSHRAQITDFGLTVAELGAAPLGVARGPRAGEPAVTSASDAAKTPTQRRVILGTPDYMTPEAAFGLPVHLDPVGDRHLLTGLDVYGLGASLYAVLAGRPPYRADIREQLTVNTVLDRVREGPTPSLSDVEHPRIPVDQQVSRVVAKAMARDPFDRYPTARALAEDLEAILEHRPTSLDHGHPVLRTRLFLHRNRLQVGATASILLMVGALGATGVLGWRLDREVRAAEQQITTLDAQRAQLEDDVRRWEAEADQARGREREAQEIIAETESTLDTTKKRAWRLRHERDAAHDLALRQEERAVGAETELETTRATAAEWEQRANTLEQARDAALAEGARWQEHAEALVVERDSLTGELDQTSHTLKSTREELANAQRQRQAAEDKAAQLAARLRRAERERDLARQRLQAARQAAAQKTPPSPSPGDAGTHAPPPEDPTGSSSPSTEASPASP